MARYCDINRIRCIKLELYTKKTASYTCITLSYKHITCTYIEITPIKQVM